MFENIKEGLVYKNLFNGEWIKSRSESIIDVHSPVNGDVIGKVQAMTKDEIDKTIENSKRAQKDWSEKPINERAAVLHECANLLEENISVLSDFLQKEIAKNKSSAISEVKRTASFIRFTADEAKHMEGETITGDNFPGFKKNKVSFVHRIPLGTVLAISPFNYPINLSVSKIAPALAAGNSVILKPPSQGSISALYVAEIFNKAGIPKGVLNTVTGKGSEIGDYIVTHPGIDFINFTGSTEVGKHIAVIAGMVPMLMELGGKDAAIVLEDSDLRDAAKDIVAGAYIYSGQRCTAIKRVLAINNISDKLAELMLEEIKKLKVGMPEDDCEVTPLINSSSADFVQELIDDALRKGAKLLTGNKREKNLMYPTLLDNVTTDMRIAWEEPFGPVLPILRVQSVDEAIEIANKSQYGLQSSVFTKNIDYAFHVSSKLEVGTVQINDKTERGPDHFPFLGVKASGMGTQGIRYSIESMTRKKVIVLNIHEFS